MSGMERGENGRCEDALDRDVSQAESIELSFSAHVAIFRLFSGIQLETFCLSSIEMCQITSGVVRSNLGPSFAGGRHHHRCRDPAR